MKSVYKRTIYIAVSIVCIALLVLVLLFSYVIPWYRGTLESIYNKQLANEEIERASMLEMNLKTSKVTISIQRDPENFEALKNYLFSLNLRSKAPQSYKIGDVVISLFLSDSEGNVLTVQIYNNNIIKVIEVKNAQNNRNVPYVYWVKNGIDIDKIYSFFIGAEISEY